MCCAIRKTGNALIVIGALTILASPILALGAIGFAKRAALLAIRETGKVIDRIITPRPTSGHSVSNQGFSKCW